VSPAVIDDELPQELRQHFSSDNRYPASISDDFAAKLEHGIFFVKESEFASG